ncbi:MAG: hypothetical protein JKY65_10080 [Planctomycetes bacterium]|nr:hypothetical protein [Planctomycetota bacterium]
MPDLGDFCFVAYGRDTEDDWDWRSPDESEAAVLAVRLFPGVSAEALGQLRGLERLEFLELPGDEPLPHDAKAVFQALPVSSVRCRSVHHLETLGAFPDLRTLSLAFLDLAAPELQLISQLSSLESIEFEYCCLDDASLLPSALAKLTRLKTLPAIDILGLGDLSPLAQLSELESLDLRGSGAVDEDLAGLTPLPSLNHVNVTNLYRVKDLSWLAGSPQLEVLEADATQVSDLSSLSGLTHLRELRLSGTPVESVEWLRPFERLELLTLDGSLLDDAAAEVFAALPALSELSLVDTQISDAGAQRLCGISRVNLAGCPVSPALGLKRLGSSLPSVLKVATEVDGVVSSKAASDSVLRAWELHDLVASEFAPAWDGDLAEVRAVSLPSSLEEGGLDCLRFLPKLEAIHLQPRFDALDVEDDLANLGSLRELQLTPGWFGPGALGSFPGLRRLSLLAVSDEGGLGSAISRLDNLEEFACSGLKLSEEALEALADRERLRVLSLEDVVLVSPLTPLGRLKSLRVLSLRSVVLVDELRWLEGLQLEELRVRDCAGLTKLSALEGMRSLRELHLSGASDLTDFSALRSLEQLETLELREVSLDDSQAGVLGELMKLRSLDLSGTLIGDELGPALANLTELKTLNLDATGIGDQTAEAAARLSGLSCSVEGCWLGDDALQALGVHSRELPVPLSGELGSALGRPLSQFTLSLDPKTVASAAWLLVPQVQGKFTLPAMIRRLAGDAESKKLKALVLGEEAAWHESHDARLTLRTLEAYAPAFSQLSRLRVGRGAPRATRLGDVSPIVAAFPALEVLELRGSKGIRFSSQLRHETLETLRLETGWSADALRALSESSLPALRELELWLGGEVIAEVDGVCLDAAQVTFAALEPLTQLRKLSIRYCEGHEDLVERLASSPLLEHLEELDLSYCGFGEVAGEALLKSSGLPSLQRLGLNWHYLGQEMVDRFLQLGVAVELSAPQGPTDPILQRPPPWDAEHDASA